MSCDADGRGLLRQVDALIADEDYRAAVSLARELILRAPQWAGQAWVSMAVAEERAGRREAAAAAFRKALGLVETRRGVLLHGLGLMLYETGRYGEAAVCFDLACREERKPYRLVMLARSLYRLGSRKEGIRAAEEAIERDPTYDEAYQLLGYYLLDEDPQRAASCLLQAIGINPECATAYGTLSELAWRKRDYQQAVEYAQHGTEIDPGHMLCWVRAATALEMVGNVADADAAFRKSLDCTDDENEPWARRKFAEFLQRQGEYEQAKAEFEYLLRAWPEEEDGYEGYLAFLEEALGQDDRAAEVRKELKAVRRVLERETE